MVDKGMMRKREPPLMDSVWMLVKVRSEIVLSVLAVVRSESSRP